jgi:hypothetical protein
VKAPTKSGPCSQCGQPVIVDMVRDSVSHAEPVCASFERMMSGSGPGLEEVFDRRKGKLVPVAPRHRRS